MRKFPAIAAVLLAALAITSATPLLSSAQSAPPAPRATDDFPHRTARAFAPFLRAIILHRFNTAQQIFQMRRNVQTTLEQTEVVQILSRFQKPDRLDLNLVGGRTLGQNIGILLFTVTNEDGPVYFKIYYYGFEDNIHIARMEISDGWDDLEAAAMSVESLPNPITVSLSGTIDEGGQ